MDGVYIFIRFIPQRTGRALFHATVSDKGAMRPIQWFNCNDTLHHAMITVIIVLLSAPYALSLYVVPGSNCTPACSSALTAYKTNGTDIACHDRDYNGTVVGEAFQDCVTCEMSSESVDPYTVQTDLGWALCESP